MKNSQTLEVLLLLKKRKRIGLSASEAAFEIDCWRLSARIYDLRASGHEIETITEPHAGGRHARYFLKGVYE